MKINNHQNSKILKKVTLFITTLLCISGCAKEDMPVSESNYNPDIVINLENDLVKTFLDTHYDESDYTYTHITDYVTIEQTERKDFAEGILLEWENNDGNSSTEIIYATTPDFDDSIIIEVEPTVSSYKLCNLIPNKVYWLKVINNHSSVVRQTTFATTGRRRLINLSIGFNCRDLAGY